MWGSEQIRRASYRVLLLCTFVAPACQPAFAVEVEGVQPAALDQPRVNICFRRDPRGQPLSTVATALAGQTVNIQAFLDTGASGVLFSRNTAKALGLKHATAAGDEPVVFHDVGVAGTEEFAVSEPLYVGLGTYGGPGADADQVDYPLSFGPVRAQISTTGSGLIEMITGGGLDVVGMPAMKGRVVVIDPTPVDTLGDTLRVHLLDPRKDRRQIPKTDRHVLLSYASFARFTRTEPAGAQGPALADNPFIGPSPVAAAAATGAPAARTGGRAKPPPAPRRDVPPVVVTLNGKQSSGSWLLDTGAAASIISAAQAKALGVTYAPGTEGTDAAKLEGVPEAEQFTLMVGGIGGQKNAAGFFLETLTLPTRERDPVVYKRAPVLVIDITVADPATGERVTLDGVLGMNYFVASANVRTAAGGLPDINNITAGPYAGLVFDEPAGVLGLKLKPELLKPAKAARTGNIEVKPARGRRR